MPHVQVALDKIKIPALGNATVDQAMHVHARLHFLFTDLGDSFDSEPFGNVRPLLEIHGARSESPAIPVRSRAVYCVEQQRSAEADGPACRDDQRVFVRLNSICRTESATC
uniref:Uncharacterized protein MLCL622.32 n=1 Tax=Mycobacterium leprae TaxID=1769 RepID=O06095_MYCLR|nr:unknown [Mycobacterium leprae]